MTLSLPSPSSAESVVSVNGLTRRFGNRIALDEVSLHVPRGSVFGLVGENGAGKTTLLRHVLGLLRPETGTVRVLGLDPAAEPVEVLSRTGYLSETRDLPDWMRIGELLRYTRAFYRTWDASYAESLRQQFELPSDQKIRSLSQGQLAKAGLLVALAFRPELLVLDEPSSGLDPVVRRDILEAIIRTVAEERRTVLFSSHLLDEIERVCDYVAMIRAGRVLLAGRLDDIKAAHRRLYLRFEATHRHPPRIERALVLRGGGQEWSGLFYGDEPAVSRSVAAVGAEVLGTEAVSLDEIFVARSSAVLPKAADPAP
ncbi:MAG: ABC transporter ATP-binding protein [Verrucomicrobiales bacterium]|nr:ABC transporter ATP-binding protein [Verrucomicrobiales bacterium]